MNLPILDVWEAVSDVFGLQGWNYFKILEIYALSRRIERRAHCGTGAADFQRTRTRRS